MIEGREAASGRRVWGVAGLVDAIAQSLAERFSVVVVGGEIAGFTRAASGHCYFTLKDADGLAASLRCAMFRRAAAMLDFSPADGALVELRGRVAVYEPRGELQFVVEAMRRAGAGSLYEQFLKLRARLTAEGLFDAEAKRALPSHPRRIGVVTSTAGAALHDVLTALARRAPQVEVVVYPSLVQGAEAPPALVSALRTANARAEVDLLLLVRGGGSLEDLWAFNDERVVRAVAASALPVVCGVGHETDVTLCDLAADLRAPTPTAAAELAAPSREALLAELASLERGLALRVDHRLQTLGQRLDRLALRLARPSDALARQRRLLELLAQRATAAPGRRVELLRQRLEHIAQRHARAQRDALARQAARLDALQARLQALDPQHVLARGYAWLDDGQGGAITSVQALQPGAEVRAVLADGSADLQILRVRASPQG
ncbi:exodeoxyribonuclease VII large subunit [Pelomonas aquatica]|uniref:Exodeoxyribonuclease 7 large subunit n=1 Tax=Pelomonas aquatica TaxID=431058 RepID=A0A9X4R2P5_9BURK|nr:exodeoxyribonuclease VII large subunit [Pelomonas aquatica]MCY4753820.1 exodeoxyribonuclease VII large subunit [Pelomonas aquatica]MDG0861147.1 exodeoxyribonuclease VII large subunit [Pelomonas aquatica]